MTRRYIKLPCNKFEFAQKIGMPMTQLQPLLEELSAHALLVETDHGELWLGLYQEEET